MSVALENTIYISDKAKAKVKQLMADAGVAMTHLISFV